MDSILIDEARTPLIISGPATVSTHQYDKCKPLVEQLVRKQTMLCNRLATEAKELFEKGKNDEAGRAHVQGETGPAAQQRLLLRMMEDPEKRKADREGGALVLQGHAEGGTFALKEELFFTIDERRTKPT